MQKNNMAFKELKQDETNELILMLMNLIESRESNKQENIKEKKIKSCYKCHNDDNLLNICSN